MNKSFKNICVIAVFSMLFTSCGSRQETASAPVTIRVPEDQPSIQEAIDTAPDGAVVLIAPGTYTENVTISRKSVTLASHFLSTGDEQFISNTIIDGDGDTVVNVTRSAGPNTRIIGLTIQNGDDGIKARAKIQIVKNRFLRNKDGVDYATGGGLNSDNLYENNIDDALDLDGATEVIIENNIIRNSQNDGIEISLHRYSGPVLNIIIRNNIISSNVKDGIQLIDYAGPSDRVFVIERNLFQGNLIVALGLMDDGESTEDLRAASIPERIYLINNTFTDNPYCVTGGDNLIALNNIFMKSTKLALKDVDGNSIAAHNLFWANALDSQESNLDTDTNLFSDPLLAAGYRPQPGSPAIDSGTAHFEWKGETVLDLAPANYFGMAPDLGAYESSD